MVSCDPLFSFSTHDSFILSVNRQNFLFSQPYLISLSYSDLATHKSSFNMALRMMSRRMPSTTRISKRLVFSYILDWIIIVWVPIPLFFSSLTDKSSAIAATGGGFSFTTPYHRPFSLTDPEISYPYVHKEKISTPALVAIGLIAPAAIIFLISLIFVPGPTIRKGTPWFEIFKIKLWELNTGWLGLALALASSFFISEGVKNLVGEPRPDLLARCNPNLDLTSQAANTLGGFGRSVSNGIVLVSSTICQQRDKDILDDGFKGFFSGHSSCK